MKLVIADVVERGGRGRSTAGEGALYRENRRRRVAGSVIRRMVILKAGFIHRARADNLCLGDLGGALIARIESPAGRQIEAADSRNRIVGVGKGISARER